MYVDTFNFSQATQLHVEQKAKSRSFTSGLA